MGGRSEHEKFSVFQRGQLRRQDTIVSFGLGLASFEGVAEFAQLPNIPRAEDNIADEGIVFLVLVLLQGRLYFPVDDQGRRSPTPELGGISVAGWPRTPQLLRPSQFEGGRVLEKIDGQFAAVDPGLL